MIAARGSGQSWTAVQPAPGLPSRLLPAIARCRGGDHAVHKDMPLPHPLCAQAALPFRCQSPSAVWRWLKDACAGACNLWCTESMMATHPVLLALNAFSGAVTAQICASGMPANSSARAACSNDQCHLHIACMSCCAPSVGHDPGNNPGSAVSATVCIAAELAHTDTA